MKTAAQSVFTAPPPPAKRGLISGAILAGLAALALTAAAPTAAQTSRTLTLSATGNNGDRDAAPGLQVNEGDSVTITLTLSGTGAAGGSGQINFGGTAANGQDYDGHRESGIVVYTGRQLSSLNGFSEGATYTITDDSAAEPDETITLAVPAFTSLGGDTIVPGEPLTITILANDGYVDPNAPVADNPAARGERLEAPVASAGRGVGQLASQAVAGRLAAAVSGAAGANSLTIAGRDMSAGAEVLAAQFLASGYATGDRDLSAAELLRQSGFNLTGRDGGRGFNFWGGGDFVSAEGDHDGVDYDGDTSAFTLGIDTGWKDGLIGVAVSRSDGDVDFTVTADGMKSTLETTVTTVHPYLTRQFNRSQLWLTAGHGSGDAELKEPDARIKTDITVTTAAFGVNHAIDAQLNAGISALYTRAELDDATGGGRALPATTADSLRVAATGEARWTRGAWSPYLDFQLRHDSGDGDTGIAGDLGGGIEFRAPTVVVRLTAAATVSAEAAEESRAALLVRKSSGDFDLGLNLGMNNTGLDTARLVTGEWRF